MDSTIIPQQGAYEWPAPTNLEDEVDVLRLARISQLWLRHYPIALKGTEASHLQRGTFAVVGSSI
jgi:hypothetical protein